MFGRVMEDVFVFGVAQEAPALGQGLQVAFAEGDAIESGHQPANFQAAVRVEVVDDPVKTLMVGETRGDLGQVRDKIDAGACAAQVANDLAGGNNEGRDQTARAKTDVFLLARSSRLH